MENYLVVNARLTSESGDRGLRTFSMDVCKRYDRYASALDVTSFFQSRQLIDVNWKVDLRFVFNVTSNSIA